MSSLSSLYSELNRYRNLLSSVQSVCGYLKEAAMELEPAVPKMFESFQIDGESADNKKLSGCMNRIDAQRQKLNDKIIPAISRKINEIEREIERLEEEEREEQERERLARLASS